MLRCTNASDLLSLCVRLNVFANAFADTRLWDALAVMREQHDQFLRDALGEDVPLDLNREHDNAIFSAYAQVHFHYCSTIGCWTLRAHERIKPCCLQPATGRSKSISARTPASLLD